MTAPMYRNWGYAIAAPLLGSGLATAEMQLCPTAVHPGPSMMLYYCCAHAVMLIQLCFIHNQSHGSRYCTRRAAPARLSAAGAASASCGLPPSGWRNAERAAARNTACAPRHRARPALPAAPRTLSWYQITLQRRVAWRAALVRWHTIRQSSCVPPCTSARSRRVARPGPRAPCRAAPPPRSQSLLRNNHCVSRLAALLLARRAPASQPGALGCL